MATTINQLNAIIQNALTTNLYSADAPFDSKNSVLAKVSANRDLVPPEGRIDLRGENSFAGGNIYDDRSLSLTSERGPFSAVGASRAPSQLNYFDPFSAAHWLRNILRATGILPSTRLSEDRTQRVVTGLTFLSTNFLLAALNPTHPEMGGIPNAVYNPLHVPLGAFLRFDNVTLSSPNLGAALSVTGPSHETRTALAAALNQERLIVMRNPQPFNVVAGDGFIGDIAKPGKTDTIGNASNILTVQAQVDQTGPFNFPIETIHRNIYTADKPYLKGPVLPLETAESTDFEDENLFRDKLKALYQLPTFPDQTNDPENNALGLKNFYAKIQPLIGKKFTRTQTHPNDVDMQFAAFEDENEGVTKETIPDSELYMPFMFEDTRKILSSARFLYFRAFLKQDSVVETFVPDWHVDRYYGRVDQVPIYQGTIRTISFSFDVVAFKPNDLPMMYKKLHILQSMVYPTYDIEAFLNAGPIIRIRIGDLFSTNASPEGEKKAIKRGLPGYITSLDVQYDNVWNIREDFKVPRKASVSINFTVLHEGNPGVYLGDDNKQLATRIFDQDKQQYRTDTGGFRGVVKSSDEVLGNNTAPHAATNQVAEEDNGIA